MIPVLQLDPMSLVIWMEPGKFGDGPLGDATRAGLHAAWQGSDFVEAIRDHATTLDEAEEAAWLGSCMWHEKRHFFDLCLTSYGAWRLRHMFAIAANSFAVGGAMRAAGQPIVFPLTVYHDKIRRKTMGISEVPPDVTRIAADIVSRKKALATEQAPYQAGQSSLSTGGDAQMEALALISQWHCIARLYGSNPASRLYRRFVNRMARTGLYRWVEMLSQALGCAREGNGGVIELDYELASALLVAGLCGRWLGKPTDPSSINPSERLGRLMSELGPKPGRFGMSTDECADIVDGLARRIWGRGLWEELEADIEHAENVATMLKREFGKLDQLCSAFDDQLELRRHMVAELKAEGPAAMSPRAFAAKWADQLRPLLLHVTPEGNPWLPGQDSYVVDFGGGFRSRNGSTIAWAWTRRAEPDSDAPRALGLNPASWSFVLNKAAPLAKLAMFGRRHDLMLEQELENFLIELTRAGLDVRFLPPFDTTVPQDRASRCRAARSYAELVRRDEFICDITGDRISVDQAMLIRAGEFRRSPLVAEFRRRNPDIAELFLARNWSDWIVRADLLE